MTTPNGLPPVTPIEPITLLPATDPLQEGAWLRSALQSWLDREFIPEAVNSTIASRVAQIYIRQRMEGENDLGALVMAIVTEMQSFNFTESFFGEFAVANAVSDLILESLGIDNHCCGRGVGCGVRGQRKVPSWGLPKSATF